MGRDKDRTRGKSGEVGVEEEAKGLLSGSTGEEEMCGNQRGERLLEGNEIIERDPMS